VSSQLSVAYHEVSVIHGHDRKSLVQTKAQGRTKAVTVSIIPAIVSMAFNAHPVQSDVAGVHEVSHVVLLVDVDQDVPVNSTVRSRLLMNRSYRPVLGPYYSSGVEPVDEKKT
jgi:hypothetical protein